MPRKKETAPSLVKVTLKRSKIGRTPRQVQTLESMGLRKLHQTVELQDTPSTRGMIATVGHLVAVDE
jgi:large subunit ribosomal protein L30